MVVSNLWYALCTDVYQLFAARFVVGIAAANYAIATAYLSYATSAEERAKVMAWNSASSVLGMRLRKKTEKGNLSAEESIKLWFRILGFYVKKRDRDEKN